VPGANPGQQIGFGLPRGDYAVDEVTWAPVEGHYPVHLNQVAFVSPQDDYQVNLNHVPYVCEQDHYQVQQVQPDLAQEHHPGVAVSVVQQQRH